MRPCICCTSCRCSSWGISNGRTGARTRKRRCRPAGFILAALDKKEAAGVIKWVAMADAFSMMCNILGQYLLSTAYMEQWYFWILVNISTILMWVLTIRQEPDSAFAHIYIVKYSFYLLNSLNGLRIWYNLSRPETA